MSWKERALCYGSSTPESWYTENLPRSTPQAPLRRESAAKQLCVGCPVMRQCAAYALENQVTGIVYAGVATAVLSRDNVRPYEELRRIASGEKR
jgi:hypothetical protein